MYSLGVNLSHDRSACLIDDTGRIVCIAEERLDRQKHSSAADRLGRIFTLLPTRSIEYCLSSAGIGYDDLDVVVFCNAVLVTGDELRNLTVADCALQAPFSPRTRMHVLNHHLAHAYSAYYPSGLDEALVVVADKGGSIVGHYMDADGVRTPRLERATVYHAKAGEMKILTQVSDREGGAVFNCNSLGGVYEMATVHVGYQPFDAGKIMGLAPFGSLDHVAEMRRHIELTEDGFEISPVLQNVGGPYFPGFFRRHFGEPGGRPKAPNENDAAVARAAQEVLEEVMLHICRIGVERSGCRDLCMAGGIALNSVANAKIRRELGIREMFIQPAAADDGTAVGAAAYGWCDVLGQPFPRAPWTASKGRTYSEDEIVSAVLPASPYCVVKRPADFAEVASLVAGGRIIAWFQGGSEFGPRALGNRSILADARRRDMKDVLNERVKHRESYRPYAASVLSESAADYFKIEFDSPHMLFVVDVHEHCREKIPSIAHVDGTCRVQTVRRERTPVYYDFISEFHRQTGTPMVLNTSFNLAGEPIVETPEDAVSCFLRTEIDAMYMEGYLLKKPAIAGNA